VAAVDNGALSDHDSFQAGERRAYQGTCVAIIRSTAVSGEIAVTATAGTLAAGTVKISAAPEASR
jgi:beta-galactosidase